MANKFTFSQSVPLALWCFIHILTGGITILALPLIPRLDLSESSLPIPGDRRNVQVRDRSARAERGGNEPAGE